MGRARYTTVPRGFAPTTPARAAQCRAARVPVVQVGERVWAPAWAAQAPDGTTNSMLRKAKTDTDLRAALEAAARISPLTVPPVTGVDPGVGTDATVHTYLRRASS